MPRSGLITALAVAAVALLGIQGAQAQQKPKIRFAWIVVPSQLTPIFFAKEGIAKHLGKSYDFEPVYFQATPPMITALATGEIDIAPLGYSSLSLAVTNAGMSDLKVIADEFRDGVEGYYSNEYMVLKDSPIQKVEDLKGKVLATNAYGSAIDMASRVRLRRAGLEDKRDYSVMETPLPTMKSMLAEKKTDLMTMVLPFSFDPQARAMARTLFTQRDAMGVTQMSMVVARAGFVEKNRAAVVDFLEDMLRAIRWYQDPANREEGIRIVSTFTKLPAERFSEWLFTKKDYYRDPDGRVDADVLQKNIDLQREIGFLRGSIDAKKHVDMSLVAEAAKRLQ
jgi:sulfonate transport system substrate-binding protein